MKTQNAEVGSQKSELAGSGSLFGISYRWLGQGGKLHLGRSVGHGRDRAHAERRFFKQHRHVMLDEAGGAEINLALALGIVTLFTLLAILSFELGHACGELSGTDERIEHLQFEVKTLTHALGEVRQESLNPQPTTLSTNLEGGVN